MTCHDLSRGAPAVPGRTTEAEQTFLTRSDPRATVLSSQGLTVPTALDPLFTNRDEIRELAKVAQVPGMNCLGMCCGTASAQCRLCAGAPHAARARGPGMKKGSGGGEHPLGVQALLHSQ